MERPKVNSTKLHVGGHSFLVFYPHITRSNFQSSYKNFTNEQVMLHTAFAVGPIEACSTVTSVIVDEVDTCSIVLTGLTMTVFDIFKRCFKCMLHFGVSKENWESKTSLRFVILITFDNQTKMASTHCFHSWSHWILAHSHIGNRWRGLGMFHCSDKAARDSRLYLRDTK